MPARMAVQDQVMVIPLLLLSSEDNLMVIPLLLLSSEDNLMVIPLLLLSSEDNLWMNCSPVLSVQCLWSGAPQEAVEWVFAGQETLTKLPRSTRDHYLAGRHSLSYPLSFLSCYLERLVRSLVYLSE